MSLDSIYYGNVYHCRENISRNGRLHKASMFWFKLGMCNNCGIYSRIH